MDVRMYGLGTALPERIFTQEDAVAMAALRCPQDKRQQRLLQTLYRRAQVHQRHGAAMADDGSADPWSFYPPPADASDHGPTTAQRMQRFAQEAPPLAVQACTAALQDAATQPQAITHLITVSCTGFFAPGLDAHLIQSLGLAPTVSRTHVGFMGCHGTYNALDVARHFAMASTAHRVLVCAVELCSLHFSYGFDPQRVVANALFGDGAAAVVLGQGKREAEGHWRLLDCGSVLLPDTLEAMSWAIGDHGFEMTLSPQVPGLIQAHLRPWFGPFLNHHDLDPQRIGSWAIHPGGPRVVESVLEALQLPATAADASRDVLARCGNMSSVTTLFILEALRRQRATLPCVALGFGPGLVAQGMLWTD